MGISKNYLAFRLSLIAAAIAAPSHATETTTLTYDELGRLVSASNSGGPRSGQTAETRYDLAGNRQAAALGQALPPPPANASVFSITGPTSLIEGNVATFTVTKTGPASSTLTVNVASVNGTAVAPGDFGAVSTTLSFLAWETAKTVSILIANDGVSEGSEQFSVTLSSPSAGATISTGTAVTTISGAPNQPPVAGTDMANAPVCTDVNVNLLANDTDPEGNYPLEIVSVSAPTFGSLFWLGGGIISFTHSAPGSGTATYVVRDSLGATANGSIIVAAYGGPCE